MIILKKTYNDLDEKYQAAIKEISRLRSEMDVCGKYADKSWLMQIENNKLQDKNDLLMSNINTLKESLEKYISRNSSSEELIRKLRKNSDEFCIAKAIHYKEMDNLWAMASKKIAKANGRMGSMTKKINKLSQSLIESKNFLGRIYWPATQYCTVQPQPIL